MYTRADAGCEDVEVHWVTVDDEGTSSGFYGGGPGYCITDPVWSPNGSVVGWIRQRSTDDHSEQTGVSLASATTSGNRYELHLRGWHGGAPEPFEPMGDNEWAPLDLTPLEDGQTPVRTLRATDWVETDAPGLEMDGRVGPGSMLRLSASHEGGAVQAARLGPIRQHAESGHSLELGSTDVEPEALPDARPLVSVGGHEGDGTPAEPMYSLVLLTTGDVGLHRATGDDVQTLPLAGDVLDADQAETGDAWLSASGDTVVLGVAGDAWTVRVQDAAGGSAWDEPQRLPDTVVHAAPVADGRLSGKQTEEPAGDPPPPIEPAPATPQPAAELPSVVTDGAAITLDGPEGPERLVAAVAGNITDFAVHPTSTADDITVAWREGSGCDAALHWTRIFQGTEAASGTVTATCPGRPVFAPDGNHLAWISQERAAGAGQGSFVLESLPWWTGPYTEVQTFALQAQPAETVALDLRDWVWTEGMEAETAGLLHLTGSDSHGTLSAYTAPIGRHHDDDPGDPQLVLPEAATAEQVTPFVTGQDRSAILRVDSHHNDGAAVGPEYTLEQRTRGDGGRDLVLVRDGDGDQSDDALLPAGLLEVNTTGEVDDVWMTARGDDVLLGDGVGRAWWLSWSADGWSAVQELEGTVRYALPFVPPDQETGPPTS